MTRDRSSKPLAGKASFPSASTIAEMFSEADQVYVGVNAARGPHVTPELFAVSAGHLWCMTAASTLKAKVLGRDDRVAFMARGKSGHVVGIGRAAVMDPMRPASIADAATVMSAPFGASQFVLRNAKELAGAARDALLGKLGNPLPPHRVLLSIEPTALATVDGGNVTGWGWPDAPERDVADEQETDDDPAVSLSELPEALARLADDTEAALGWRSGNGHPLVIPARWDRESRTAAVAAQLLTLCGAASASPVAVTLDQWTGFGPTGKQGLLLRGTGSVGHADADDTESVLTLSLDRATYWDGVDTDTAPIT